MASATVTVTENSSLVVNLVLQAEVSGAPGKSQGGASGVSGVVSSKSVTDLPLNGRSASDLATLEPGVASARTQSTGQAQRGFGNQMTISGGRPRQNDARLDGISVNDYVNGPPGSALGINLGSDAVEQFSVLTSNYPAQFGRSSGGIIGASTRSGTKDFHGNAFEYIRNSVFDARNFFDTAKPAFHRNQFGGSIGGPVVKDRTFFFADYEGLRQSQGITQVDTVPSQACPRNLGISHERGFFWVHVGCERSGKLRPVEEQKAVLRGQYRRYGRAGRRVLNERPHRLALVWSEGSDVYEG